MDTDADCVIIGNGPSRQLHDITSIKLPTFGCNQIYRDHQPTYLLAQDRKILNQMQTDGITCPVYVPYMVWRRYSTDTHTQLPDMRPIKTKMITKKYLTGEWCVILASQLGFKHCLLLGFDGGVASIYRQDYTHAQPTQERYAKTLQQITEEYKIKLSFG